MLRSYCCCLMLGETSQSTWPDFNVMARASAMSAWMDEGMAGFAFAAPTHSSVEPFCSNSLAPSCTISAPETSESTTLVGKRCSRYDSMPMVLVVLIRMHVCCGDTTDSMTPARS